MMLLRREVVPAAEKLPIRAVFRVVARVVVDVIYDQSGAVPAFPANRAFFAVSLRTQVESVIT